MAGQRRPSNHSPLAEGAGPASPLARHITNLLTDVERGSITRWRVTSGGKLLMAFPGHLARDEKEARVFAAQKLGALWRPEYVLEALR